MGASWQVTPAWGTAGELHESSLDLLASGRRALRICHPSRPAVVLGSTQPESDVDRRAAASAGADVVRRRSGGGAVLVVPGELVWVDVVVPATDPLWDADVGRAARRVGRAWAGALASLAGPQLALAGEGTVAGRALSRESRWAKMMCFAGIGPGEVTFGGRKVVGLSQRRTRHAALFHCAAILRLDPGLADLLALGPGERREARQALESRAAGIGQVAQGEVAQAFADHLP